MIYPFEGQIFGESRRAQRGGHYWGAGPEGIAFACWRVVFSSRKPCGGGKKRQITDFPQFYHLVE
jgi:hypothetical protein